MWCAVHTEKGIGWQGVVSGAFSEWTNVYNQNLYQETERYQHSKTHISIHSQPTPFILVSNTTDGFHLLWDFMCVESSSMDSCVWLLLLRVNICEIQPCSCGPFVPTAA